MSGDLFLYSFLTACFSAFLDYCMLEGEIFGKYRELVEKMGYWGKPLGGCAICTNAVSYTHLTLPTTPYV